MEQNYDEDLHFINEKSKSINYKCYCCGKNLKEIREHTFNESCRQHLFSKKLTVRHWLGINVKYFCLLHCSQRCVERLLFSFCFNDEIKVSALIKVLVQKKIVRKSWKFNANNNILYPQMLFGGEAEKITLNYKEWATLIPWFKEYEVLKKKVYKIIHQNPNEQIDQKLIRKKIDIFIFTLISRFGREAIQFYFHIIDFHFIDMYDEGISLPILQQQGFEHSHSLHKTVQKNMTSNESAFHCTPSSHQIFFRQMRIFVIENEIFIDMENLSDVNNIYV